MITARERVIRKLLAARAVVSALEELLEDMGGEPELPRSGFVTVAPVAAPVRDEDERPVVRPAERPEPPACGHSRPRENHIKIARALAERPMTQAELVEAASVPKGSIVGVIARGITGKWWQRTSDERSSTYELTELGRRELLGEEAARLSQ